MADLKKKFSSCEEVCDLFSPVDIDNKNLQNKTTKLVSRYPSDFDDPDNLYNEIIYLKSVYKTVFLSEKDPIKLLNLIYEKNLETIFLNICTAIRLFCTIPVTVSTAERSFSKLSNSLKTWQRSTTGQDRLNHLAVLSIENELAKTIDFSDVIEVFSQKKARKMVIL